MTAPLNLLPVLAFVALGAGCSKASSPGPPSDDLIKKREAQARASKIVVLYVLRGPDNDAGQATYTVTWRNDSPDPIESLRVRVFQGVAAEPDGEKTIFKGDAVTPGATTKTTFYWPRFASGERIRLEAVEAYVLVGDNRARE